LKLTTKKNHKGKNFLGGDIRKSTKINLM